ncbi:MAG TPA: YfhO family protein, partial [Polyangia bacterium]
APPRVYRSEVVDAAIEATAAPDTVAHVQRNLVRTLIDNHAGSFGIASVPGYDAAMPATLSTLWLGGRASGLDLLRLTGVEYAILPTTDTDRPGLGPILDPVPGVRLFHVNDVLPRVYVASAAAVLPDSLARQAVFAPNVVAGRQVILAPNPTPPASTAVGEPVAKERGSCRLTAFAHAHLGAECQTATPALAVFLEQFDMGWTAQVDGQTAALLRANLTMRAVPLTAGRHQIELSFSPPGLRTGLTISLASLLVLVAAFLLGRRQPAEAAQRISKAL